MGSDSRVRLVEELRQLRTLAGEPTLADLEKQNPALLKQQTVSDLLAGKGVRLPLWERIAAFVTACVRIGEAKKLRMPQERVLLEQWRRRHAALAGALDHAPLGRRGIPTSDNSDDNAAVVRPRRARERRRFGAVPPRAGAFRHRAVAQVLIDVDKGGGTTVLTGACVTPARVLTGLGGVGKTQLAADYAHNQWESGRVDVLVWISARNRDAITAAYAEAAMDMLDQDPTVPERAWRRLLEWLAETTTRWLVVLDDLQSPGDLSGLWPPHSPNGHVVVTTRCRDAALHGDRRRIVDVDLFTPEEALAYLTEKLPDRAHTDSATADLPGLAHDLGYLPLALAQAAAYLINKPLLTTTGYRAKLADRRVRLLDLLPRERDLPDEHEQTVAATWSLSIEAADQLDPTGLARPALELTSLLDPAGIPATVFTADATTNYLSVRLDRDVTGEDVLGGLECLKRFSLLTLDPGQPHHAVRVHALVQRAVRDTLTTDTLGDLAWAAADAVLEVWTDTKGDPELTQALRSNTSTLQNIADECLWQPWGHEVLFHHASSLGYAGLLSAATMATERLHHQASTRLGPDHPVTLKARSHLANLRGQAGDLAGAVTAFEELLTDRMRVLGPDHPDTLTARNHLANWRGHAGDPAGAATAFEEMLGDYERLLGSDHFETLVVRGHLATWRGHAGELTHAVVSELEDLLADEMRILGPDHAHTLAIRRALAAARGRAGDAAGAIIAFEEMLSDHERALGADHPDTLAGRSQLAYWRIRAGDLAGAAIAFSELLTDHERVLGPDHPHTLTVRSVVANWHRVSGEE